jgi:hypothetical protein
MDEEFHERKDRVARDPGQSFQEPGPVMIVFKLWANLQRKRGSSHGAIELSNPGGRIGGVSRLDSIVVVSCRC